MVPGEVGVRFIALLRRFDRAQGPVWGGKVGARHLKCRLDPAAWVHPGEMNTRGNCACCNEGVAQCQVRSACDSSPSGSRFDRTQGPIWGGKVGYFHLKCRLDPAAWVLPGEMIAMENFTGCNEGVFEVLDELGV